MISSFIKVEQATKEDFIKLQFLHKSSMYEKVIDTVGFWDEEYQKQRLYNNFIQNLDTLKFVFYEHNFIGCFNLHFYNFDDGNHLLLEQFYLSKEFQGKGFGSHILESIIEIKDKKIRLSVLKKDINVHNFYIKHGFKEYNQDEFQKYFQINF